jgi:hypothetical protein
MASELKPNTDILRRLKYWPILITMVAAAVLCVGSFFGCANSFMGSSAWATFFFVSFLVFAAVFVGALIWLIVAFVLNVVREGRENQ